VAGVTLARTGSLSLLAAEQGHRVTAVVATA
jgi:hypothetical protein